MDQIISITARELMAAFSAGALWFAMCYGFGRFCCYAVMWIDHKIKSKKEQQNDNV